jgi:ATP-dependent helicase STH1/SNF2
VDDDEDSPEAAAARKATRKERREQNRLKRAGQLPGSIENSPAGSRDSTEEPEPTPKKGRGRKAGKADKRKAEDIEDEPPAKRKRGPPGRAKPSASANGDALSSHQRNVLQKSLRSVYDTLMNLESASDSGSEDDEDDERRLIIGPFVALPPKKDFPDYYMIIKEPISMKMIEKKIKKEEYSSLNDIKKDIQSLCTNAKTYNEDGSMIYVDAVAIENACSSKIRDELNDHPEFGDLDDSSRNGGSTAPTTSAGTPMATTAASGKIKLTFNNAQYTNGGSSGIQSDDDNE